MTENKTAGFNGRQLINIVGGIAAVNILLALVSFVKDLVFAAYMGTSYHADALLLAYFIPDTIGNNLLGAGLNVAVIPVFSILYFKGMTQRFRKSFRLLIAAVSGFTALMAATAYFFAPDIIRITAGGIDNATLSLSVKLLYIIIPSLIIFPLVNIYMSILQIIGRFKTAAFVTVIYNTVFLAGLILALLFIPDAGKGVYFSAAVLTGAILAMFLFALLNTEYSSLIYRKFLNNKSAAEVQAFEGESAGISDSKSDVKSVVKILAPYIIILASTHGLFMIQRYIAAGMPAGTVSGLNYAFRLAQFPVWVFVAAIAAFILPSMSRTEGDEQREEIAGILIKALNIVFIVCIPIMAILYFLRVPAVTLLFGRGAFDSESIRVTSAILAGYSLTIAGQAVCSICLRVFAALKDMKTPMLVFTISSVLSIYLEFKLTSIYGIYGFGYGLAIGSSLNSVIMLYILNKRLQYMKMLDPKKLVIYFLGFIPASAVIVIYSFFCDSVRDNLTRLLYFASLGVFCIAAAALQLYFVSKQSF